MKPKIELIDWSERYPSESSLQVAVRQSTFCLCGKSKAIGQANCGCQAPIEPLDEFERRTR